VKKNERRSKEEPAIKAENRRQLRRSGSEHTANPPN